jgi:hypothetical protein
MIDNKPYIQLPKLPSKLQYNYVLLRLDDLNKERLTPGGLKMTSGLDDSKLEGNDVYDQIDRYGVVEMLPEKLVYNAHAVVGDATSNTLDWDTEIEIQLGDTVWMRQIDSNTCTRIQVDGKKYKIIRYDSLTVAKRGVVVIPLNGYILMSPYQENWSNVILTTEKKYFKNRGIVRYFGSKNKDYKSNWGKRYGTNLYNKRVEHFTDMFDVAAGEVILTSYPEVWIESDYINTFGEKLKICQRRHMMSKLSNIIQ